jgi:hypothetical protein
VEKIMESHNNPKNKLQEYLIHYNLPLPHYTTLTVIKYENNMEKIYWRSNLDGYESNLHIRKIDAEMEVAELKLNSLQYKNNEIIKSHDNPKNKLYEIFDKTCISKPEIYRISEYIDTDIEKHVLMWRSSINISNIIKNITECKLDKNSFELINKIKKSNIIIISSDYHKKAVDSDLDVSQKFLTIIQ